MSERQEIEQAIAALEAQWSAFGEDVIATTLMVLRRHLGELEPQPASAERKQVTVMFADISGFTAMSEKLDPEEVRSLINACFERLGAVIDRYQGHIDKFIGDEIMALFGAPMTHENDPERALRAALEMMVVLEEFNAEYGAVIPKPLALHFGINTGLVIAGGIGTRHRQDYSVMGDTVNLAARLEDLSETGEILAGEDTYRLTASLFEFEALKPVSLKGKQKPVQVYRLLGARATPSQGRGIEGLFSPLVGRQAELSQFKEVLARLVDGQGRLVCLIGEAGLGKSRLVAELRSGPERVEGVQWAEGRSLSHAEDAGFWVARNVFRSLLDADGQTPAAEVGEGLRTEIETLLPGQLMDIYPYLAHLLELPLDEAAGQRVRYLESRALRQQVLAAAQAYITAKARQRPLVLIWDDLQWIDPSSLELLEALISLACSCPLLLVLLYRPARESRVWNWQQGLSQKVGPDWHLQLELSPLTPEESRQLVGNLLGTDALPEKTCALILDKAEGNPFFVEEMIRSLIEMGAIARREDGQGWKVAAGIEDIQIPDTLQGVIMARIDRLRPETKWALQVASVVGRTFPYQVLARIIGDADEERRGIVPAGRRDS